MGGVKRDARKAKRQSRESVGTTNTSNSAYESSDSTSDSDSDSSSDSSSDSEDRQNTLRPELTELAIPLRPASTSGLGTGVEQWTHDTILPRPSSVPVVEDRTHNGPIPVIEMTSPDAERARPFPNLDSSPPTQLVRTTSTGTGSSGTTDEFTQSTRATSTQTGIAAPVPRTPITLTGVTPPPVPRSQQYVHRRALKRYLIAIPPPVLVIHLKRFQQVAGAGTLLFGSLRKLDDFVAFPEVLDIAPFVAPNREDYGMGRAKINGRIGDSGGKREDKTNGMGWFANKKDKDKETAVKYRLYAVVVHIGSMVRGLDCGFVVAC